MDYVAIDLGASNTRYISIDRKVNFVDNSMLFIEEGMKMRALDRIDDTIENNLELIITREGAESKYFANHTHVYVGELTARSNKNIERVNQNDHKVRQRASYVSVVLAITLSKLKNTNIGERINLFQLLPPSEVASATSKETFIETIKGKYKVELPRIGENGTVVEFEISDVYCCEEGRMAIIQFLLDDNHPDNRTKYGNRRIMSIDVGQSTTDVCIFENGKFIERSGNTLPVGCYNCIVSIVKALESMGKRVTYNDASRCLIDGRRPNGATRKPIPEIVNDAKTFLANDIISRLDGYFTDIGISLDSIEYVVVSGGGSMPSSYIDEQTGKPVIVAESITTHIANAIQTRCDGIEVVHIEDDPRTANIRGLGLWAVVNNGEIKH